jgi:hypothetical protein
MDSAAKVDPGPDAACLGASSRVRAAGPSLGADYDELRVRVLHDEVIPDFLREVQDVIVWRWRWRKIANWAEGIAHLLLAAATVLVYSAGYFDKVAYLAYVAGCVNVGVLALLRIAAYANKESSERNVILNRHLRLLGLSEMPDITADLDTAGGSPREDAAPWPRPPARWGASSAGPRQVRDDRLPPGGSKPRAL